jgi:hypothetical protein
MEGLSSKPCLITGTHGSKRVCLKIGVCTSLEKKVQEVVAWVAHLAMFMLCPLVIVTVCRLEADALLVR